jgi:hypothetical protein
MLCSLSDVLVAALHDYPAAAVSIGPWGRRRFLKEHSRSRYQIDSEPDFVGYNRRFEQPDTALRGW